MSSEEDPMIRGILQQLDAARNGTYTKTLPELKKQWTRQLASIDDTLARQDLQPKERAQLEHRREQLQIILDSLEMRRF